ncbi:MAG: hypothetical protein ACI9DH_000567 [Halioglobus sp.]|jgi:hypothetical protein
MTKSKASDKSYLVALSAKVVNRHTGEAGVVSARADNQAGNWYLMATVSGMSIGWWHETDLKLNPKTVAPDTKREG